MKDFRGRPIQVHDFIVYPSRKSSSLWVTEAQVLEIIHNANEPNRQPIKLRVQPLKDGRKFGKVTTLNRLNNITRVDPIREPAELRVLDRNDGSPHGY